MKELVNLILQSKHLIVLTGAGMSTESGLADFRSNGGLWDGRDPHEISHPKAIGTMEFIQFFGRRIDDFLEHKPNTGHHVLAKLEEMGYLKAILTQNIDGFHQRAGSKKVIEVHGHLRYLVCSKCRTPYPLTAYREGVYHCSEQGCRGHLRPPVILFGEDLEPSSWYQAIEEAKKADLVLVLGTSLTVYPFASLVEIAKQSGATIVIINQTETGMDDLADRIIRDQIGSVLGQVSLCLDQ